MNQPPPLPWVSPFLADVDAVWTKRRKAIQNKTRSAATLQIDESDDDEERFVLSFSTDAHTSVTVIVRASRWFSVVAAEQIPDADWAWQYNDAGRLAANPAALIAAIEQTLAACPDMTAEQTGRFDAIWHALLAKGPREIG